MEAVHRFYAGPMANAPDAAPERTGPERNRGRRRARMFVGLAVVVLAVVFVVQNSQKVTVRWWFVTAHVRLIWVIGACLVVAGVFGYVLGRGRSRRRRKARGTER